MGPDLLCAPLAAYAADLSLTTGIAAGRRHREELRAAQEALRTCIGEDGLASSAP